MKNNLSRTAYLFGAKLAMVDAGITDHQTVGLPDLARAENPAEALAVVLQAEPDATENPEEKSENKAEEDGRTFSGPGTSSVANDLLNSIGLDVRGPEDTSI